MPSPDTRICFIGDSFVNGACDPEFLGWTGRVCAAAARAGHTITHYNLGIRRDTSVDIAARWQTEVGQRLNSQFDSRLVFSFGANDTTFEAGAQRLDREASLHHARQILGAARELYPCLWIGPPPVAEATHNQRSSHLCAAFELLAAELKVPYLPVLQTLSNSKTWMEEVISGDGAHPQAGGYREMARLVQAWPAWWF
ncbi:lipase [bacterium]|nr:MAG: lipase [bacterium]